MLNWIEEAGTGGGGVAVGKYAFLAAFNMLGNVMMSEDLVTPESEAGVEFYGAMKRVMEWSGKPNVSDLFPWSRWLDMQGLKRKADRDMGIAFAVASAFVKQRIRSPRGAGEGERDFLDVLLESDLESGSLSENDIIIFILVTSSPFIILF